MTVEKYCMPICCVNCGWHLSYPKGYSKDDNEEKLIISCRGCKKHYTYHKSKRFWTWNKEGGR